MEKQKTNHPVSLKNILLHVVEKQRLLLAAVIFFTLHFPGYAFLQSSGNTSDSLVVQEEKLSRELDEVVVQAFNRSQELIRVPGALTSVGSLVLDRERPSINVLPVLQYASGVIAQQGATNTSRVIIRGTGARVPYATGKIRAYFNNIPLTNTSGVTFIEDIDPAVVERLQIIKGPAPSVYGAGLGGTIILNARDPRARTSGLTNTTHLGAFGLFRNTSTVDLVKENSATSLVFSHVQSQGYRENNEYNRNALTVINQTAIREKTEVSSLLVVSGLKSHIPSSIDSVMFAETPRAAAANWLRTRGYEDATRLLAGINISHIFSDRYSGEISFFGGWHDEKEMRPFDVFYEERFTIGTRYRYITSRLFGVDGLELSSGGEVFRENYFFSNSRNIGGEGVEGDQFTDNREDVNTLNYFSQIDADLGKLILSGGINLNYSSRNYTDRFNTGSNNLSGNYNYGFIVSPRLAANYQYFSDNAIYLSLSNGFSPPSLDETLTPEGFINPDIKPERSWSLEFGFRGKLQKGRFFYDVSLYRMVINDLLVAQRVGEDAWVGRNAGQSLHRGLEAEIHWVIFKNTLSDGGFLTDVSLRSNFTFNNFRFTDFIDREVDRAGNLIPGVPEYMFFAGLFASTRQGFYVMPSWRYVGKMAMNDANTRFSDAFNLFDVSGGYRPNLSGRLNIDVFARANNIFNRKYSSMVLVNAPSFGSNQPRYYYPGLPFHLNVGIRFGVS